MNILLTSAGRRSYLVKYFKEALEGRGKVHASNSQYTIALQEADQYFISPLIYQENYVEAIVNYCLINEITVIISVFDIDLLILSKAKQFIESKGIRLILPAEDVVEICNDKWKTYQFLLDEGIKTPKTYKDLASVKEALSKGDIDYPVIIKPRWGMASMGIYVVDNEEELNVFSKKTYKEIQNSYLKYESSLTPEEAVLFQEKLVGQEYGLDVINDLDGNFVCVLPKSKILMRAGETDLGETIDPERFTNLAIKISNALKHEAIMSVDCFEIDGDFFVIEMNSRISGHYPLSHIAGTNLPKQIIQWVENKKTDMNNFKFETGLYITKDLVPVIVKRFDE